MDELQGHMAAENDECKALCGEPDAYIIDVAYGGNVDRVSCEKCLAKAAKLFGGTGGDPVGGDDGRTTEYTIRRTY